ncbi:MAG: hypothetical protein HY943_11625 [Gammaproteobacteria bacterium]|nr:hypothetical protein [Gammaproteobacteria bacterium]
MTESLLLQAWRRLSARTLLTLLRYERMLRAQAAEEQRLGRFTLGLSRAIDVLDELRAEAESQ